MRLLIKPPRQRKLRFFTRIDNRGTEEYGPIQYTLGTQIHNPWRANDQLDLSYSGTFEFDELHYFAARYARALNAEGTTLSPSGTYSDGDPGTRILDLLDYRSDGYTLGFTLKYPLVRGLDFSTWVFGGYRYQNFRSGILDTANTHNRLSFFDLGLSLDWADALLGDKNALNLLTLGLPRRWPGRLHTVQLELVPAATTRQPVVGGPEPARAIRRTPLLSSQEWSYRGAVFGRGFEPSTLFGDHCTLGSLELTYAPDSPVPANPQSETLRIRRLRQAVAERIRHRHGRHLGRGRGANDAARSALSPTRSGAGKFRSGRGRRMGTLLQTRADNPGGPHQSSRSHAPRGNAQAPRRRA